MPNDDDDVVTCSVCKSYLTDAKTAAESMQPFICDGTRGIACPDCWATRRYRGLGDAEPVAPVSQ